jgi:hypothetical protein
MSHIEYCPRCGGHIITPAYPGDGVYPVPPMCSCREPGCWHEANRSRIRKQDTDSERLCPYCGEPATACPHTGIDLCKDCEVVIEGQTVTQDEWERDQAGG